MPTLPKLNWQTVKIDTLPADLGKAYAKLQAARQAVKDEQTAFETKASAILKKSRKVPDGKEPRFAYNWGKLAIGFADETEGKTEGSRDQFAF